MSKSQTAELWMMFIKEITKTLRGLNIMRSILRSLIKVIKLLENMFFLTF